MTRPQKHDRRGAWHLMELLVEGKFPRIWLPSAEEGKVRVLLNHRHSLVEMRTRVKNGLQALASRQDFLRLLAQLNGWIRELDKQLAREAQRRPEARRLQTHPGVGPLTALATVVVLGPAQRFENGRKVASYIGLIPSEYSSGGRQHFGHLTK